MRIKYLGMKGEIRPTDIKIAPNIYVAADCIYNKKKRYYTKTVARVVYHTLGKFRTLLNFNRAVVIRICSIKGTTEGRFYDGSRVAEISYRLGEESALQVLAHELVHAEQYYEGRLRKTFDSKKGWIHSWQGCKNFSKGSTYSAYRNQPWEKEAWGRQEELAKKVREMLETENG